jgi:hypothetical protein
MIAEVKSQIAEVKPYLSASLAAARAFNFCNLTSDF